MPKYPVRLAFTTVSMAHGPTHRTTGVAYRWSILASLLVVTLFVTSGAISSSPRTAPSTPVNVSPSGVPHITAITTCPNSNFYGVSTTLTLQQVVDCAAYAGYTGNLEVTFVSMAYQESGFCAGAIESGSGTCYVTSPGCGSSSSYPNAEGVLQEGTGGQCPPAGGTFPVGNYNPAECPTWSGSTSDWGGIYFNPMCSFNWSLAYYNSNGFNFWGSYLSGAYCQWAPSGFAGMGSEPCDSATGYPSGGTNSAGLAWSTICPGNVCQSDPLPSYSLKDLTTGASVGCSGTFTAGDKIQFTATVQGGTPSFTYAWNFGDGGTGTGVQVTHTYTTAATVNPTMTVTDSTGRTGTTGAGCSFVVSSAPQPSISSFTATPATITLGASTKFVVQASGGTTPYSYSYSGLPTGCSTVNASTLTCTPTVTGGFTVKVTLKDARSQTTAKNTSLSVSSSGPTITAFTLSSPSITLGKSVWINATVTGGTAPYTYSYTGLPSGCSTQNLSSLLCTPNAAGTSPYINVSVTDASHATNSKGPLSLSVTVPSLLITSFTATPPSIVLGSATQFQVVVSGGATPLQYVYTGLPTGCLSTNSTSLPCTPSVTGNFSVKVTVTDAQGRSTNNSTVLAVLPSSPAPPAITSFTISPPTLAVNGTAYLNVTVSGGSSPLQYSYGGLPAGCSSISQASITCRPTSAGTYSVKVTVTDSLLRSTNATASLTVTAPAGYPSITSFVATPPNPTLGSPINLLVKVTGGAPPYTYLYSGLPPGCVTKDTASLNCTPSVSGSYSLSVLVTDTHSHSVSATVPLTVGTASSSPFLLKSFVASQDPVNVGVRIDLNATVTGGSAPYSYSYTGLPSGCVSSSTPSLPCTPTINGTFAISVTVHDSASHSVSGIVTLTVVKAATGPGSTSSSPSTEEYLGYLAIAALAVAAVVLIAAALRRKRQRAAPRSPFASSEPGYPAGEPPS